MREVGISQVDAIFSGGIYPIEFLFYYSKRFETKWLRRSLRQLSSDFWPVFGEYADGKIYFERYLEDDFYDEQALNIEFRIPESEAERLDVYRSFQQPDLEQSIAEREKTDLRPFDPDNGCLVTNISRLPVARLDFGTGVPELLFPLTIEKNSAAIMADKQKFILRFAY